MSRKQQPWQAKNLPGLFCLQFVYDKNFYAHIFPFLRHFKIC